LALGALALPAAALLQGTARAQGFTASPLPPDAARADPLHAFWDAIPDEFPLRDGLLYFNTGGLGIPPRDVLQRAADVALEVASSGETLREKYLEPARQAVARACGADPAEIALTRNATESMNLVARGLDLRRGDEVILTTHEHPGGAMPWVALAREAGVVLRIFAPSFDPARDAEDIWGLANRHTRAVAVSHVLCTTGYVLPVREICAEARRRGVWAVIDGAQATGTLALQLHDLGADAYIASGHKWLLAPTETGFLYVRRERLAEVTPRFVGAYSDAPNGYDLDAGRLSYRDEAAKFEYGTRSAAAVAGLLSALEWRQAIGDDLVRGRATALAGRLHAALSNLPGIEVLTPAASVSQVPIVTFRVTRRPNSQVAEWFQKEMRIRVRRVGECGLNAVRVSTHLVNRTADVDWLIEGARALGA
jgi:selenocysteine lyase/cysteine desulfurase